MNTVSESLESVARAYVPGVVQYYSKLDPDPWQRAHDDFQETLAVQDFAYRRAAAATFERTCLALIDRFKREGTPARKVGVRDAIELGTKHLPAAESKVARRCYKCGSDRGLCIERYAEGLSTRIACQVCKARNGAKR